MNAIAPTAPSIGNAAPASASQPLAKSAGQLLREQNERRAREAEQRRLRGIAQSDAELREHERIIRTSLSNGLSQTVEQILEGRRLKPIKLPRAFQDPRINGVTVSDKRHPDHPLFAEFVEVARLHDLVPDVKWQQDGFGTDSWHELSFEPA